MPRPDWWNDRGSLMPVGYTYAGTSPSKMSNKMQSAEALQMLAMGPDRAGDEIFGNARRGRGRAMPTSFVSPIAMDQERVLRPLPDTTKPSFFGNQHGPPDVIDTTWRTGDMLPISLDGSPRAPRKHDPVLARDPELAGYPSNGIHGYGGEILFGVPAPSRPSLDMDVAKWRLSAGEHDPHPFTLNGAVPKPSPRRDPRRLVQGDLMMHITPDNFMAVEAARQDLLRYERAMGIEGSSNDRPKHATNVDQKLSTADEVWQRYRSGDSAPLVLGDLEPPRRVHPVNTARDANWRAHEKNGVHLALGAPSFQDMLSPRGEVSSMMSPGRRKMPADFAPFARAEPRLDMSPRGTQPAVPMLNPVLEGFSYTTD